MCLMSSNCILKEQYVSWTKSLEQQEAQILQRNRSLADFNVISTAIVDSTVFNLLMLLSC